MTTHIFHPDVLTAGLADDCERCQEHADDPASSLDDPNRERLLRGDVYTATDRRALENLGNRPASQKSRAA